NRGKSLRSQRLQPTIRLTPPMSLGAAVSRSPLLPLSSSAYTERLGLKPVAREVRMASTCVVGLQWGDEAKGKIVDLLTADHHIVVRYNGGANAGHTIVKDGKTYKLSLLPTGILSPHMTAVIGNGLVVNPVRFLEEIKNLRDAGIAVGQNLVLSD